MDQLIVNNVVVVRDSPFLAEKARQQQLHLEALRERYAGLSIVEIPLFAQEVRGIERLARVGRVLSAGTAVPALAGR